MVSETIDLQYGKCPKCHKKHLKQWQDLSADEKFVTESLPMSAEYSAQERQQHLFCVNCWYETKAGFTTV